MHHTFCLVLLLVAVAGLVDAKGKVKSVKFTSGDDLKGKQKRADLADEIDTLVNEIREGSVGSRTKANGKGNGLKKKSEFRAKVGNAKQVRLDQEYDGLRVFGKQVVEHVIEEADVELKDKKTGEKTGEVIRVEAQQFVNGEFVDGLREAVGSLNAKAIGRKSNKMWKKAQENSEKGKKRGRGKKRNGKEGFKEDAEPLIYVDEETQEAQVAFLAQIFVEGSDEQPMDYVNVLTDEGGNVIKEWSALQSRSPRNKRQNTFVSGPGGNAKIGTYFYNDLRATQSGGLCRFQNDDYRIVDLEHTMSILEHGHDFQCPINTDRLVNTAPSAMNDAQKHIEIVYDMYNMWYGDKPFIGCDSPHLRVLVHAGNGLEDAYAYSHGCHWNIIYFGDGLNTLYPLPTALDVVSHEIAHIVTIFSSGLNYVSGEPGCLNEAFSDMAGKAAEFFDRGQVNWGYGYDIWKGLFGRDSMRCMDNPQCDGLSIDHISQYVPGMDIHHCAGPLNKVFYELSQRFLFGVWDAFDLFYWTNVSFWTPTTDYRKGAELTLKTLDHMRAGSIGSGWSYDHLNPRDVVNVFAMVGIRCRQLSLYDWVCQ